ncbi:hypothetical protein HYV12_01950 [Candidatus Dojkabacteria bacterium]|nr:hypothetical protein [Candidatus Dojkabacteria bacterium]
MRNDEQTLKNIFEESAAPNRAFVKGLEKRVISEFQNDTPHNNFISQLFMKIPSNPLKFGVLTLGAILFVGVSGGASYYAYDTYIRTPAEKKEQNILAQIALRNPSGNSSAYDMAKSASATTESTDMMLAPEAMNRDYNYRKTTTTYNEGPSASKCRIALPYQGGVTKDETYQYFIDEKEWVATYSKYTVYIGDDIYDYNLNVKDEQWSYKGGQYAVHTTNVEKIANLLESESVDSGATGTVNDAPVIKDEEPTTIADPGIARFGDDAKIIDTVTRDGREYYKIQWSYNIGCSEITDKDTVSLDMDTKSVTVALADAKTYEIVEESIFLTNTDESNRLYTRNTEDTTKTVDLSEVQSNFKFSFSVPVKTYDVSKYDYTKAVIDYLKQNNLDVLKVNSTGYELESVSSAYVSVVPDYQKNLIDRAFYSSKPYGEKLYNESKDMFAPYIDDESLNAALQLSYSKEGATDYSWIALSEYSKEYSDSALLKAMYYDSGYAENKGTVNLFIDGKDVSATVYSLKEETLEQPGSGDDPNVSPETLEKSSVRDYLVLFTYENRSYVLQTNASTSKPISELGSLIKFSSVSSTDTTTLSVALTSKVGVATDLILK